VLAVHTERKVRTVTVLRIKNEKQITLLINCIFAGS